MHVFVFWGQKKKAGTFNGNLKSLEEPNVPELMIGILCGPQCLKLPAAAWASDCSSNREETGPAELLVWTRQVQPHLGTSAQHVKHFNVRKTSAGE